MKDNATLLQELIIASEHVLGLRNPGDPEAMQTLVEDVGHAVMKPTDIDRVMHDYTAMLASSVMLASRTRASGGAHLAPVYFRIVGVLLPDVRADFGTALEQRKRPTA